MQASEKKTLRTLRAWHLASAGFHFASFIAQLVVIFVYSTSLVRLPVTIRLGTVETVLGCVAVPYILLSFAPLTALFHLLGAQEWRMRSVLTKDRDGLRATEYTVTAGIMTVAIALISGVWDLNVLIVLILLNVITQQLGYDYEALYAEGMTGTAWRLFAWSSLSFVATWYPIFYSFFNAVGTTIASGIVLPWFVYTVIVTLFFMNLMFPLLVVMHRVRGNPFGRFGFDLRRPLHYAIGFMVLSFIAKFTLNWFVLLGGLNARIPLADQLCQGVI